MECIEISSTGIYSDNLAPMYSISAIHTAFMSWIISFADKMRSCYFLLIAGLIESLLILRLFSCLLSPGHQYALHLWPTGISRPQSHFCKGTETLLWRDYGRVLCIYSIRNSITVNVSVCHSDNCVSNPSSCSTLLAETEGTNVPNMSPGTSGLPNTHSESACVIKAGHKCLQIVAVSLPYSSLLPAALMSLCDSNYKVNARLLCTL